MLKKKKKPKELIEVISNYLSFISHIINFGECDMECLMNWAIALDHSSRRVGWIGNVRPNFEKVKEQFV